MVARYVKRENISGGLRSLTKEQAHTYLENRGKDVGQKTLDMERQAIQMMMRHVTGELQMSESLTVIKSAHQQILNSRAYTPEQVREIVKSQTIRNSLSTEIAHAAGLRAHELLSLQRIDERKPSDRPALDTKFKGREGVSYTVKGKGGLIREVIIPQHLAQRLEERRLERPKAGVDRGINYKSLYDINGGNKWSASFTKASERALGWSTGAHGVRHSYAQERVGELRDIGLIYEKALETVSQEVGHFRAEITEVYLR